MKTEQRTALEDRMAGMFFGYINHFRGGIGHNPQPDPEDREMARELAARLTEGMPTVTGGARLASVIGSTVEVGAYWGIKLTNGFATVDQAWWTPKYRRPMKGDPATKLERQLNEATLYLLGKAQPKPYNELTGEDREAAYFMSWAAEAMYEYKTAELPQKPPVAQVELPMLHRDIAIRLLEAGLLVGNAVAEASDDWT